jgi:hypothetical protein
MNKNKPNSSSRMKITKFNNNNRNKNKNNLINNSLHSHNLLNCQFYKSQIQIINNNNNSNKIKILSKKIKKQRNNKVN